MLTREYLTTIVFLILGVGSATVAIAQPSMGKNFVVTNTIKQAGITAEGQINDLPIATQGKGQTINYFDGLGRPLQTVMTQGSGGGKDIVSTMLYDSFGREAIKYLPYVETSATGGYGNYQPGWQAKQAAFYNGGLQGMDTSTSPFSQTVIEASPLNRVLAHGAPGSVWQPNLADAYDTDRKVIKIKYEVNKSSDSVRIWNVDSAGGISSPGIYSYDLLTIKTSIDEHNGVVKEYTDKSGHIILKRVFIETDSLQTYYIYDDFEELRAVIQPEGSAVVTGSGSWSPGTGFIDKWVFLYRYDGRNRMVMKKVPGTDSVLMLYDQWDRLVLTQDGNQRLLNHWLFTKYDVLNRPVVTGCITDTRSQATIRSVLDTASAQYETVNISADEGYTLNGTFPSSGSYTLTLYTITHYDSYDYLPTSWKSGYAFVSEGGITAYNTYLEGRVVATQTKILNSSNWLRNVVYYDDKYRMVQSTGDNSVGGKDRITKVLTFDGKVSQQFQSHSSSFYTTPLAINESYTYDNADRLLNITHQINNQEVVTVAQNAYNELGQLLNKKIHQSPSHPSYLQKLDYSYNIRGWLNGINQPYSDGTGYDESDLFNFALHYDVTHMDGATAQYNGNISEALWKGGYDEYLRGYEYTYDKANRLKKANYGFKYLNVISEEQWDFTERYNEQIDAYDRNGNIQELERFHGAWTRIDDIHYQSWDGNKLLKITDWQWPDPPVGYHDQDSWIDDYRYDQNGNLTFDFNKSIDTIHYNHLNLPDTMHVYGQGSIKYIYDAGGNKLQKTVIDTTGGTTKITTYKYAGAFVYKNDTLELVNHEEGRLRPLKIDTTQGFSPSNLRYAYDYFMKDHLGNIRMVITSEAQTALYAATEETAAAAKENQLFTNLSSTQYTKPAGFDTDTSNHEVARLNGNITTTGNYRVGPSLIIKVMAGDTVSIATRAWYSGTTQAPPSGLSPIADELVSLLTSGLESAGATHGGGISTDVISTGVGNIIPDFLDNTQTYDPSKPKAFLNWIVVDEEFTKVNSINHLGAVQVPTIGSGDTSVALIGPSNMVVRRNGWLYVYVSNESNQDVFFDNIVVNHRHGPVEEQSDYYPFGYEIPGLSSKANLGSDYSNNRRKYNGIEETKELNLEEYDAFFRNLDPLTGRWWQIDPKCEANINPDAADDDEITSARLESISPYASMNDDPVLHSDPLGDVAGDGDGGFWDGIADGFTGTFKSIGNAIAHPVTTLQNAFSVDNLKNIALNTATLGVYGIVKDNVEIVQTVHDEGAYGVGKVIGNNTANLAIAVVTDEAIKGVKAGLKPKVSAPEVKVGDGKSLQNPEKPADLPKPGKGKGSTPPSARDPKRTYTKTERAEMLQNQNNKCAKCGASKTVDEVQGHHKVRHADGGKTDTKNGVALCKECHVEVHQ